jgi:hypothetical protein
VAAKIGTELRNRYLIGQRDGECRKVEVKVAAHDKPRGSLW